jgi:hypothetical protein
VSRPPPRLACLLALGLLAGCPLPQTLPEFPDSGTITPPRIRSDEVTPPDSLLVVATDCPAPPIFELTATVVDENTTEPIEARWFIDYLPAETARAQTVRRDTILGPENGLDRIRPVPVYAFDPYASDPGGVQPPSGVHVVELVVSNGFASDQPFPASPQPNRMPKANFETQVHRWVFHYAPGGACGFPAP